MKPFDYSFDPNTDAFGNASGPDPFGSISYSPASVEKRVAEDIHFRELRLPDPFGLESQGSDPHKSSRGATAGLKSTETRADPSGASAQFRSTSHACFAQLATSRQS